MDDDRILAFEIEDSDLEQRAVSCGTDQDRELVTDVLADRIAQGVLDVLVRYSMSARRLTDPHLDKLSCLPLFVNISCLPRRGRRTIAFATRRWARGAIVLATLR
jgi:hypothetical protein